MSTLSKTKVIGITGSIGSGKSQVSKYIKEMYPVIDCDQVNAQLLEKGQPGYEALMALSYVQVQADQTIDKVHLANVMFSDCEKKKEIESILHPLIFKRINQWIQEQQTPVVFVEMPILFEIGATHMFDEIWCVYAPKEEAISRLSLYRGISKEEGLRRWNVQLSPQEKMRKSDVVIYNDGTLADLYAQVQADLEKVKE